MPRKAEDYLHSTAKLEDDLPSFILSFVKDFEGRKEQRNPNTLTYDAQTRDIIEQVSSRYKFKDQTYEKWVNKDRKSVV